MEARVEELIDADIGAWKNELVQRLFLPHEADAICFIALSSKLPEDRQVWAPTAIGNFSVRGAYKIEEELASRDDMGSAFDVSKLRIF